MFPINFIALGPGLICLRYLAPATFDDWVATLEAALAEVAPARGVDLLLDRRGIVEPPSTQTVRQAVDFFDGHRGDFRRVAAVIEGDAVYGMFRMLEMLSDRTGIELRLFKTCEEALGWLEEPAVTG